MDEMSTIEKEYEALATVRDILLLLYSEISENTGDRCESLHSAFEFMNELVMRIGKGL